MEFTQVIKLPKMNIKFERNGLATLSSKAAEMFNGDFIEILPSKDYSIIILKSSNNKGIALSKEEGYSRIRFNCAKALKDIVKHNVDIPRNFKSLKFEIKNSIIEGQPCTYFVTSKCFIN